MAGSSGQGPGTPRQEEPIPRLPRAKGFRFAPGSLYRIILLTGLLVAVLMLRHPCARSVSDFFGQFDVSDAAPAAADRQRSLIDISDVETEEELRRRLGESSSEERADPSTPLAPAPTQR